MGGLLASIVAAFTMGQRTIRRSKLRTGLTVLGIMIGITAVLLVTALGRGARERVSSQVANLGSNTLIVFPRSASPSGARVNTGAKLTERDAQALVAGGASIKTSCAFVRASSQVTFEGQSVTPTILGTRLPYFDVRAWKVDRGELWNSAAEAVGDRVVVIGSSTARDLFGTLDPVGRLVRIGRSSFRVLGVLEEKGPSPFGQNQDDIVVMPITTVRSRVLGTRRDNVAAILFSATSDAMTERAKAQAEGILRQRHRIREGDEDDFQVRSQAEFQQLQDMIYGTLTLLLTAVAAVSLLVGGIGVMNIMLVSVAERTREIGIRMAIGARERDILAQFLLEALLLGLLGGAAGVVVGWAGIVALRAAFDWSMKLDVDAVAIAVGVSSTVGVVFGFVPARRAAKMNPVAALGRE